MTSRPWTVNHKNNIALNQAFSSANGKDTNLRWFLARDNVENERSSSQLLIPIVCWKRKSIIVTFGKDGKSNPPSLLSNLLMWLLLSGQKFYNFGTFLPSGQSASFTSKPRSCRPIDYKRRYKQQSEYYWNIPEWQFLRCYCFHKVPSTDQLLAMSHGNISNRNRSLILNSRFLQRPQKRSRGNQLIHRRFSIENKHRKSPTDSGKYRYIVYSGP